MLESKFATGGGEALEAKGRAVVSEDAAHRYPEDSRHFEGLTEVAVSAGAGDHGTGWIDSRADHQPFVDGSLESEDRSAQIANRRESAHQRVRGFGSGHQNDIADAPLIAAVAVGRTSIAFQ